MGQEQPNENADQYLEMGYINGVHGVKGWVKVFSHTQPRESIFKYSQWFLKTDGGWKAIKFQNWKTQGKGLIAQIEGLTDRNEALALRNSKIAILQEDLPELEDGEFYYHQLEGLTVITENGDNLGKIDYLFDTGANDVIVVKPSKDSIDGKERLLPYLEGQVVKHIDLSAETVKVDWDPEF